MRFFHSSPSNTIWALTSHHSNSDSRGYFQSPTRTCRTSRYLWKSVSVRARMWGSPMLCPTCGWYRLLQIDTFPDQIPSSAVIYSACSACLGWLPRNSTVILFCLLNQKLQNLDPLLEVIWKNSAGLDLRAVFWIYETREELISASGEIITGPPLKFYSKGRLTIWSIAGT